MNNREHDTMPYSVQCTSSEYRDEFRDQLYGDRESGVGKSYHELIASQQPGIAYLKSITGC